MMSYYENGYPIIHCDDTHTTFPRNARVRITFPKFTFFDGYCSTVQGLLDWFEVDLGFTELL